MILPSPFSVSPLCSALFPRPASRPGWLMPVPVYNGTDMAWHGMAWLYGIRYDLCRYVGERGRWKYEGKREAFITWNLHRLRHKARGREFTKVLSVPSYYFWILYTHSSRDLPIPAPKLPSVSCILSEPKPSSHIINA